MVKWAMLDTIFQVLIFFMLKHFTEEELEERGRKEKDPTIKERLLAILHEMIKSCEGVALDLFGERKEGY